MASQGFCFRKRQEEKMINLILILLLLCFCFTYIKYRIISNWIILPAIILGAIVTKHYFWPLILFGLTAFDYWLGFMRGGDVKLFSMIGSFIGGYAVIALLLSIFLIRWYIGYFKKWNIKIKNGLPMSPFALLSTLIILWIR